MAKRKIPTLRSEFQSLEPVLRTRINRTLLISVVWGGLVLLGTIFLVAARPFQDRRLQERMKQPGFKPLVTLKENPIRLYPDEVNWPPKGPWSNYPKK